MVVDDKNRGEVESGGDSVAGRRAEQAKANSPKVGVRVRSQDGHLTDSLKGFLVRDVGRE